MQAKQYVKKLKVDTNLEKPIGAMKYCDGILNFEPGMMLGQNL